MNWETIRRTSRAMLLGTALAGIAAAGPALAATAHDARQTAHHAALYHRVSYHHTASRHTAYHHTAYHHVTHHEFHAPSRSERATIHHILYHAEAHEHHYYHRTYYSRRAQFRHSGLQCVPYAREISHIALTGNAYLWWAEAAGRYARGNVPEQGAVLNFRAIGRMPLGHVAVVTGIINSRTILVTQANWVPGTITNDVTVQDVSPDNDWTQVKVELGNTSSWGAPYPTYGFIYDRPAGSGTTIAGNGTGTEVAEAPPAAPVAREAPNRSLQ